MEAFFIVDGSETRVSRSVFHFVFFLILLRLRGDFSNDGDAGAFVHLIDGGLSPPRAQVRIEYINGFIQSILWSKAKSISIVSIELGFQIEKGVFDLWF